MTDPLSVAASVAGLASLGIQITDSLVRVYDLYKNQYSQVARTSEKLESLSAAFRSLEAALQDRTFRPNERDLLASITSATKKCQFLIEELSGENEKFQRCAIGGFEDKIGVASRRIAYPFRQSTLQKLQEDIGEIRNNVSIALEVLGINSVKQTQEDVVNVKSLLDLMRATQISSTIKDWLRAPDPSINHEAAYAKHCPGTGLWLLNSPTFANWMVGENSFLWLSGFAGCGKSIVCSTAIQQVFRKKGADRNIDVGFFYFTFNDETKQDESALLRTLLLQLSGQLSESQNALSRLYDSSKNAVPPPEILLSHFHDLVQNFNQVYILLDALDECPQSHHREHVLNSIDRIRGWFLPQMHLMVTSRDEIDVRESLNPTSSGEILLKNSGVDQDIKSFVTKQLNTNRQLVKLRAYHEKIEDHLTRKARGV